MKIFAKKIAVKRFTARIGYFLVIISVHYPLLGLIGCGTEESGSDSKEETALFEGSMAIKSKADIPECKASNLSQLVYVKDEGQFYVCEAAGWESISIEGAKGEKGDTGATGASGTTTNVGDVTWADSSTGLTWYVGSLTIKTTHSCASGFSKPSNAQALTAFANGLTSVMSVGGWCAWADTSGGTGNAVRSTDTTSIQVLASNYCHSLCYK